MYFRMRNLYKYNDMKKILLSAIALSIGSVSFGQRVDQPITFGNERLENNVPNTASSIKNINPNNKAAGDTIWSEDFTAGLPLGWTMVDNTGNSFDWVIDPGTANIVADFTDTSPIASTSGGNSMLLFGDSYNSPIPASGAIEMDAYFQTAAIPITGQPGISVVFQQTFRLCCSSSASLNLMVSTDPNFITNVLTVDVSGSTAVNSQSADAEVKTVNISSIAGGLTGDIYLRFHGSPGSSHYFWFVDDIQIVESSNNDLILNDPYFGTAAYPYSRIPVSEIQPIDFVGKIKNEGVIDQTNTVLNVDINTGAFTVASTPQTVVAGATDSLFTGWTPPATVGVPYIATMTVASDSIDASPLNNTFTFPAFQISQYVYAYDDYAAPANQIARGGLSGTEAAFEAGNNFDIWATENLTAIDAVVGVGTPVGSNFKGVLYERTATAPFFSYVAETQFYQTTNASIGNVTQLLFDAPVTLNPNTTYFAGISTLSEFYYGTSGTSPGPGGTASTTSLIYYGTMDAPVSGKNFYTTRTPMVRMNFDPSLVGIDELKAQAKFNVFPNPSNGIFNINISSNEADNVILTVKNVVGQTVIIETVNVSGNTNHKISLTDYSKGIYFLTVGSETVKLIVE